MRADLKAIEIHGRLIDLIGIRPRETTVQKAAFQQLPFWIKETVEIYSLPLNDELPLYLIIPKRELEFTEIANAFKVISSNLQGPVLLLADTIPSKARGPLVRMRIPHITSDGTLYAPQLGLILNDSIRTMVSEAKTARQVLMPLGLKLIAAHLMGIPWAGSFDSLLELQTKFAGINYPVSQSSLSRAMTQLADFEMLLVSGMGPQKTYQFREKDRLWKQLTRIDLEGPVEKIYDQYIPESDAFQWVYSGESALERLSDLAQGATQTIAMKTETYRKWTANHRPGTAYGNFGEPKKVIIELWRSDPALISVEKSLNPIELSLSLRKTTEPRTRLAVTQMLAELNLKADYLWGVAE